MPWLLILAGMGVVLFPACKKSSAPAAPEAPTPTPCIAEGTGFTCTPTDTPTHTSTYTPLPTATCWPTASGIHFMSLAGRAGNGMLSIRMVEVDIQRDGVPLLGAAVTLSGPGFNLSVPYEQNVVSGCLSAARYTTSNTWSYQLGQPYTLTIRSGSDAVTAVTTAPGGISVDSNGSSAEWDRGGNYDFLQVYSGSTVFYNLPPDIATDRVDIPDSAYPNRGTYTLRVVVANQVSGIPGASNESQFNLGDAVEKTINR